MDVTISGGLGHGSATLDFTASDRAFIQAQALASTIDNTYKTAIYYDPSKPLYVPSYGYLVVPEEFSSNNIVATGFGAIVDENNLGTSTIHGGDSTTGQTVLAGSGGLTYYAHLGDNTVDAGGGNNAISFRGDFGATSAYTSVGNDTIIGGDGQTSISAGAGLNRIFLHSGSSVVDSTGSDIISLAGGSDTINVMTGGHDLVLNAATNPAARLDFLGGAGASTVEGGTGTYTILGGAGGGHFHGASGGSNLIQAGSGAATIIGGGASDTLLGGSASDVIRASTGNETLGGGGGANLFDVSVHTRAGLAGFGTIDTITDLTPNDLIDVGGIRGVNYALNTYSVSGGSGSFLLEDGAKVTLEGVTRPLSTNDFKF